MRNFFGLLIIAFGFFSCTRTEEKSNVASDTLQYAFQTSTNNLKLRAVTAIGLVSQQQIQCEFTVTNNGDKSLKLNPETWTIQVEEGVRSMPAEVSTSVQTIGAGETSAIKLIFLPIHNRLLHQQTNLNGDLERTYALNLLCTDEKGNVIEESIKLTADSNAHTLACGKYGIMSQITAYALNGFSKEFITTVESNGTEARTSEQVTDNEVLHQGFWMKIFAHHRADTMQVLWRFVNQSGAEIQIDPSKILLLNRDNQWTSSSSNTSLITLPPSGRAQMSLRYPTTASEEFELNLSGVYASGNSSQPIFKRTLLFKAANSVDH